MKPTNKDWDISLTFTNDFGDYGFTGIIGSYKIVSEFISFDTYEKAKKTIIEMCNPDCEYDINNFLYILKNSKNSEVIKFPIWWNEFIEEPAKQKQKV